MSPLGVNSRYKRDPGFGLGALAKASPGGSTRFWAALTAACLAPVLITAPARLDASHEPGGQSTPGGSETFSSTVARLPDTSDRIIPFAD